VIHAALTLCCVDDRRTCNAVIHASSNFVLCGRLTHVQCSDSCSSNFVLCGRLTHVQCSDSCSFNFVLFGRLTHVQCSDSCSFNFALCGQLTHVQCSDSCSSNFVLCGRLTHVQCSDSCSSNSVLCGQLTHVQCRDSCSYVQYSCFLCCVDNWLASHDHKQVCGWTRNDVFFFFLPAGYDQEAEVRKDQRQEDEDAARGVV